MYRDNIGRLTDPAPFGNDALADHNGKKQIRETSFSARFPSFDIVFHRLVNDDATLFKHALLFYIDVTRRLCSSSKLCNSYACDVIPVTFLT